MNSFPESIEPSIQLRANTPITNLYASLRTIIDLLHKEDDVDKLQQNVIVNQQKH